jgi:hypothetical protein
MDNTTIAEKFSIIADESYMALNGAEQFHETPEQQKTRLEAISIMARQGVAQTTNQKVNVAMLAKANNDIEEAEQEDPTIQEMLDAIVAHAWRMATVDKYDEQMNNYHFNVIKALKESVAYGLEGDEPMDNTNPGNYKNSLEEEFYKIEMDEFFEDLLNEDTTGELYEKTETIVQYYQEEVHNLQKKYENLLDEYVDNKKVAETALRGITTDAYSLLDGSKGKATPTPDEATKTVGNILATAIEAKTKLNQ